MSIGTQVREMILVKKADILKEPELIKWMEDGKARNAFDPAVLTYPATKVFAAYSNGMTYACMPIQPVAMMESVGVNPKASPQQITAALIELVKAVTITASLGDMKEIYFLSTDANTSDGAERLGFEKLPGAVYRMRIK